ncbi:uncharacterized protein LOC113335304 [Papaver somniferum]|uniref:uncharacterized protein LOC113335304 n=1 Tax=Papaver somniferum TaxID=3469 RepID=UPI000E6F7353|nr:uncharacterized protein LOC113335304 [Papaver somniferum]
MDFKIIFWKIRGMNDFDKQVAVKNLILSQRCAICLIQETKMHSMTDWFVRQLWYDENFGWAYVPSNGYSGGILTIWDSSRLEKLDEIFGMNNITSLFSTRANNFQWDIYNVYSPCDYEPRRDFWQNMAEVREWWTSPICIAGDMNAIHSNEQRNHGDGDSRNTATLNSYILDNELIDQPLIGGAYTWSNNQVDPLLCRLDRFLFSHDFEEAFPNALQVVLTRTISYHNPILVISEPILPSKPYFKLDRLWLEHKDLARNVQMWWGRLSYTGSASTRFFLKLQNLKHLIKPWRKQHYGHVSRDRNDLTARIHEFNILEETVRLQHNQVEERTQYKLKLRNIEVMEAKKWNLRSKQNNFLGGEIRILDTFIV